MISRSDADHVRVTNVAAFDNSYDGHARGEFAGLRRHDENANVGCFERVEDGLRRGRSWGADQNLPAAMP